MKISVEDIKKIKPGKQLLVALGSRLECNTARNLVSYVNNTYPIEGYRYSVHVSKDNAVLITLKPRANKTYGSEDV